MTGESVDGSPKKVEEEAHGSHSNWYLLGAINAIKDRERAGFPSGATNQQV